MWVKTDVTTTTPSTATTTTANPLRMTPTRLAVPLEKAGIDYKVTVTGDLTRVVSACLIRWDGVRAIGSRVRFHINQS